jgi:hypothetical protein
MTALKLAFILQQEIPIWVLTFTSLFLFFAPTNIGNKFSNIILLIVSYIALITNFRTNHTGQSTLTFFEIKLMTMVTVPMMLTISTTLDTYNLAPPRTTEL